MNTKKIKLKDLEDIREFVSAASECNFDIDVFYYSTIVDAKSLLGVISLGLSKVLTIRYGGENHIFEGVLRKYAVA